MANNISKIRLSGVTYTIVDETAIHDLSNYYTTAQTNSQITAATSALAQTIEEAGYQTASDVQTAIQGKADTTAMTQAIADAVSGKANTSDLAPLFGAVEYDSSTNRINFKHDAYGSVLAFVDASPFIVDGFLDSVEIKTIDGAQYLVFTWNSDSGKQTTTNIPLSDIFAPENYYTKSEVDTALLAKANTADTYTKTQVDTALGGKQDTLVSGTNIKTINNESILGSGNIEIQGGGTIDSELSSTSTNAVQNKVITAALETKNGVISIDSETLVIS